MLCRNFWIVYIKDAQVEITTISLLSHFYFPFTTGCIYLTKNLSPFILFPFLLTSFHPYFLLNFCHNSTLQIWFTLSVWKYKAEEKNYLSSHYPETMAFKVLIYFILILCVVYAMTLCLGYFTFSCVVSISLYQSVLLFHNCLANSSTCISEVFQHVMVPSLLKFSNNFLVNFFPLPISTTVDWSSFLFPRFHGNLLYGLTQAFSLTIHSLLPRELSRTWIWPYLFSDLIISVYHLPWSSG